MLGNLIGAHEAGLYRYLKYLGADHAAAEDLLQETFLTAFRHGNPPATEESRRLGAWLRTIARNLFYSHCRKRKRMPVALDHTALEAAEAAWQGWADRDGEDMETRLARFRRCLENTNGRNRTILELRYVEKIPREEIARKLGLKLEGVKSALQRVRAALVKCMEGNEASS